MTRYIKQYDSYTCAPTVILNALKWAGKKVTVKDKKRCIKLCKTSYKKGGTYLWDFKAALEKIKEIEVIKFTKHLKLNDIDKAFKESGAVVARVFYKDVDRGHLFFITPGPKKNLTRCVNFYRGRTIDDMTRKVLYREIRRNKKQYSYGWLIRKRASY